MLYTCMRTKHIPLQTAIPLLLELLFEPRYEKTGFLHMRKTKTQISFAVTAKLINDFVFATRLLQPLYFLNPKFQASSHPLWLYSPVCVGPGWKPRRPVFSQQGSFGLYMYTNEQALTKDYVKSHSGVQQNLRPACCLEPSLLIYT